MRPDFTPMLELVRRHDPTQPALVEAANGAVTTYGELLSLIDSVAEQLPRFGPRRLHFLLCDDSAETIETYLGLMINHFAARTRAKIVLVTPPPRVRSEAQSKVFALALGKFVQRMPSCFANDFGQTRDRAFYALNPRAVLVEYDCTHWFDAATTTGSASRSLLAVLAAPRTEAETVAYDWNDSGSVSLDRVA